MPSIQAVDLFAGAGGTSTGLARACKALQWDITLTAINHWPVAIETHKKNHPWATHLCVPIEAVDPRAVVPSGKVDLLVASPECTHFSQARGGRPTSDQLRASGWNIMRWVELLDIRAILIENVPEYRNWGPVGEDGRPIKERRGETFNAFIAALRSFGYTVDWRILNAADYGEATARRRLFVLARKDAQPVTWPAPSHSKGGTVEGTQPWRAAREILDLTVPSQSIFGRKRPLATKTLMKIAAGAKKFWGIDGLEPFLLTLTHGGRVHDPANPMPTITGANRGETGIVEPFIVGAGGPSGASEPRAVADPLGAVLTQDRRGVVEPMIITTDRPETNRSLARPASDPVPTVTGNNRIGVIEPFLVANFGERDGQEPRTHGVGEPLPTVTSRGAGDLIEPVMVEFFGTGKARSIDGPVPALTTRDRVGLAIPLRDGRYLDIRFRMLQPHELSRAMGFGDAYGFTGTRTQVVKQIGNAVGVNMAQALCESILTQTAVKA